MKVYRDVLRRGMTIFPGTDLRINFDNRDRFVDMSTLDLHIPYHDTEVLLGHTFKHITKGIFKATPGFYADKNTMKQLHIRYPDVEFCFAVTDKKKDSLAEVERVVFAFWHGTDMHYGNDKRFILNRYIEDRTDPRFFEGEENLQGFTTDRFDAGEWIGTEALRPYDDGRIINGEKAFIDVYGNIGMLVEPGIYSFVAESDLFYKGVELRRGLSIAGRPAAWIGFTYLDTEADVVRYVSVDPKYFGRLKELADGMDGMDYHDEDGKNGTSEVPQNGTTVYKELKADEIEEIKKRVLDSFSPEYGAIELVQGMGFYNIELWFSRPFMGIVHEKTYDVAYKKNDDLVLIEVDPFSEGIIEERYDMGMMDKLYVKEVKTLRNGNPMEYYHRVIHDDEKLRQLLSPSAYELYMGELTVRRKRLK